VALTFGEPLSNQTMACEFPTASEEIRALLTRALVLLLRGDHQDVGVREYKSAVSIDCVVNVLVLFAAT
jgi:hypothetical protein